MSAVVVIGEVFVSPISGSSATSTGGACRHFTALMIGTQCPADQPLETRRL